MTPVAPTLRVVSAGQVPRSNPTTRGDTPHRWHLSAGHGPSVPVTRVAAPATPARSPAAGLTALVTFRNKVIAIGGRLDGSGESVKR
jgi:hypothetical protein